MNRRNQIVGREVGFDRVVEVHADYLAAADFERAARNEKNVVGESGDSEVGVALAFVGLDAIGEKNEIDLRGLGQIRDSRLIHP